jgi:hypothetical protein
VIAARHTAGVRTVLGRIEGSEHLTIMSSPRGNLASISRNLKRLARHGNVAGIRAYVCFNGLAAERRHSAMLLYAKAIAECESRAKLPLAAPIALNARTGRKLANWRDPAKLAKLADAYRQGKDHEGAARLLKVTEGAARLAKRRYLDRLPRDS